MDVIAGTILNTFGGTGETHSDNASSSDFLGTILRAIGSLTANDILTFHKNFLDKCQKL